ncbi:Protein MtfA [Microbulbifer aggregans]|uniref:Protein MtfA n=1 Tax=Microbulbifer aggregans TaxID=1769779 RepID=A0A1C9W8M8_9GAMM|nr:M90 family metallopeptidase [Microbulbifer aggregans]AOS97517.1 Protein MtfA [Microbulbifer aggregans]
MTTFLAIVAVAVLIWVVPYLWRQSRFRYLRSRPLNQTQRTLIARALPLYRHLPLPLQKELQSNISLFIQDKEFVGCEGLTMTEEIRVSIATFAALLLLRREHQCYPDLRTVLVYPGTYVARETHIDGYIETTSDSAREGEAHYLGPVVISWSDLQQDMQHPEHGRNVALHEFAHKLDEEDGAFDGRPVFSGHGQGRNWAAVLGKEYRRLQEISAGLSEDEEVPSVLDLYGAVSPAEFFAVATEAFFVRPHELQRYHSDLYDEFRGFYQLDPAELLPENLRVN